MGSVEKGQAVLDRLADTTDFYARLDCLISLGQTDINELHTLLKTNGLHLLSDAFDDFRVQADSLMAVYALKRALEYIGYGATVTAANPSRL